MTNDVIDFEVHLRKKRQKVALKQTIASAGWEIDADVQAIDSDLCVYLMDSKEPAIVLFGCKEDLLLPSNHKDIIHWGHFVLAWDTIADPDMHFDETHKINTMKFALRALPGLDIWSEVLQKIVTRPAGKRAHILIVIDREDLEHPLDIIIAYSESAVMNTKSINTIVNKYVED